jgi:hypothetical protein
MAAITRLAIRTCFESSFSFHFLFFPLVFALFGCADFVQLFRHSADLHIQEQQQFEGRRCAVIGSIGTLKWPCRRLVASEFIRPE